MDMRYPSELLVGVIAIATVLAECSIGAICYWIVKNVDDKRKSRITNMTIIINILLVVATIYYTYHYVYNKLIVLIFFADILIVGSTVLYTNFKDMNTVKLLIKIGTSVLTNILWIVFMIGCVYGEIKLLDGMDNIPYFKEDGFLTSSAWWIWLASLVVVIVLTVYIIYKSQIVIINKLGNVGKDKITKKNILNKSIALYCINLLPLVFLLFAWMGELD